MKNGSGMDANLRRALAELLAGLQVPRSICVLGKGEAPYDELRRMFNCFGWQTEKEIEKNILNWDRKQKK